MNAEKSTRFAANGPMPTVQPIQKRRDNWLDVLNAYYKISPEKRDAFWSLFDSDDEVDPNIQNLAPASESEAALGIAGYDINLARALGWDNVFRPSGYYDFELESVGGPDVPQSTEQPAEPWNTGDAVVMKYTNDDNMDEAIEYALKNKKILRL